MKKALLLLMTLIGVQVAQADDTYAYLTFETNDGTQTSVAVESLTITIADGKLQAGGESFSLTDLNRMFFSSTKIETGIEGIEADTSDQTGATYYDLQGHEVRNPGKGVYIVKVNGKSKKVILK